ncbi:MAG TPA: tetratricopeptide repeat protein [Opitutaceae bacterium]|nr:tetratricopeptide repeat protein [Opitutaceae bacterium]
MPAAVLGLVLFCYWPAIHGAFLWDDPAHPGSPVLSSPHALTRIWTEMRATQQYYPVLFSALWVEHSLWGANTFGYHIVNIVLHAASCCLLALLLRRLLPEAKPFGVEWLAALILAVHPVCVESVAWMSEQKNTLSLCFYLLSATVYLRFIERRTFGTYILAFALFLLALGSKTVTATLPAAILVVLWWKHGKISFFRDVLPLVPWFTAATAMGLFTAWFERTWIGAHDIEVNLSFAERVLLSGRIFWFYFGKLVWPTNLSFFYRHWDVPAESSRWYIYIICAIAVTAALWLLRNRNRGLLAAWLLYAGSLFPALGFFDVFPFRFSYVADHFQYLAMLGPIGGVVGGLAVYINDKAKLYKLGAAILAGFVILILVPLCRWQSALYVNDETLFRDTIAKVPSSWMAHHILATNLAKKPASHDEAIAEFRRVIELKPDNPDSHLGLGTELWRMPDQRAQALEEYRKAIELRPNYAEAHNNLGVALAGQPNTRAEAISHFRAALQTKPGFAEAHANLADALAQSPATFPEAIAHYTEALRLNPRLAWVHCHLAHRLSRIPGKANEALEHYNRALAIEPDYVDAHNGLAFIYIMTGRPADARREWETILRIDPSRLDIKRNLQRLDQEFSQRPRL